MKHTIVCCALFWTSFCLGQDSVVKEKINFGFRFGTNYALPVVQKVANETRVSNNVGFQLGILAERNVSNYLTLAIKSNLSFHNAAVIVNEDAEYMLYPVALDFSGHALVRDNSKPSKVYGLLGFTLKNSLKRPQSQTEFPVNSNISLDLGIGYDKALTHLRFVPELVYSYGLNDVNLNPTLRNIRFHHISLYLNFI